MADKRKKKEAPKKQKLKSKPKPAPEPTQRTDINTKIYRDLFKFLDEKVSTECFVDMHEQCYGKADCQCECHKK